MRQILLILALCIPAFAAHPYLLLDSAEITALRAKVTAETVTGVTGTESGSTVTLVAGSSWSSTYFAANTIEQIYVYGCSVSGYNGFWIIASVSGTSLTYTAAVSGLGSTTGCTAAGADWGALLNKCDNYAGTGNYSLPWNVPYPSGNAAGTSATRGYTLFNAGQANAMVPGYYMGNYDGDPNNSYVDTLGACYKAIELTDATRAAAFLAQAHYLVAAIAVPSLTVTRASDGAVQYAAALDQQGNDLASGEALQIYIPYYSYVSGTKTAVGDVLTVSGEHGCTALNGTFTVAAYTAGVSITFTGGGTCNAASTLYSISPTAGGSYGTRFYFPATAKLYDWFYEGFNATYPSDLTNLEAAMRAQAVELNFALPSGHPHPEDNFHIGFGWAGTAIWAAIGPDDSTTSTAAASIVATTMTNPNENLLYENLWLAAGGNGEGLQAYGFDSIWRKYQMFLAQYIAGVDWRSSPYNSTFFDDNVLYAMETITPTLLAGDDNEYNYGIGSSYCPNANTVCALGAFPTESTYIPLDQKQFICYAATKMSSSYASACWDWYNAVCNAEYAASGTLLPTWNAISSPSFAANPYYTAPSVQGTFLWGTFSTANPSGCASSTGSWYSGLPTMYKAWSGNYAFSRSAWNSSTATLVSMLGGPSLGAGGNGKTQWSSPSIAIQTGNNRLLVFGLAEASRAADVVTATMHGQQNNERGFYNNGKNSTWCNTTVASGFTLCNSPVSGGPVNQGVSLKVAAPGTTYTVQTFPAKIDLTDDTTAYTYIHGLNEYANGSDSLPAPRSYCQSGWTRELLFIKPHFVAVHDHTTNACSTAVSFMNWVMPRTPIQVTSGCPSGATCYQVTDQNSVFHGQAISVLPASATVNLVNYDGLGYLYTMQVTAPSSTTNDFLAAFDPATSSGGLWTETVPAATNAVAVQINDSNHSIAAFALLDPFNTGSVSIPLGLASHAYIAGLTPGACYSATVASGTVTVAGSGNTVCASAGGVADFSTTPITLVSIATSPSTASLSVNSTAQLTCTATYSDSHTQSCTGSPTVWTSNNTAIATVTGGLVTGVAIGSTTVYATLSGISSGNSTITVNAPVAICSGATCPGVI